ncbi:MAG: PAS protein [candidate division Zixibacteria bacterium RBG-1]|nr:MAG: PAS protein [candidate division Zixibacteria bacterium RBG-1]OGC85344.1 MAG: hypothetical protein A2V73_09000 [candidate division Zixibacteria bacterium RBG_19FT_COMBO_42_43]
MRLIPKFGSELEPRFSWIISSRLIVFVLLLGVTLFFITYSSFLLSLFLAYSVVTFIFLFFIFFSARYPTQNLFKFAFTLQLFLEIFIEAVLVYHSGVIKTPISILFFLSIVSASLHYQVVGTLLMATWASVSYCLVILYSLGWEISNLFSYHALKGVYQLSDDYFYTFFLFVCSFYLVAFISGYLSEKLKTRGEQLESFSSELKKLKMETDEILQNIHSGLITIDTTGRVVYFNLAAQAILGYKSSEVIGKNCFEVFKNRMSNLAEGIWDSLKINQRINRKEVIITNSAGKRIPLGLSTSILKNEKSEPQGVIAIFQDLSEFKILEDKLRAKDRLAAVGELSAGIAHEIRNPLASISGSVEVLKDELPLDGENEKLMELIIKETNRLNEILTEFLNFARIKPTNFTKVDLNSIVDEVIEIVRKHPSYTDNIRIQKEIDSQALYVLGEENHIKQLLLNLMVNGVEAMQEKGGKLRLINKNITELETYNLEEDTEGESNWIPLAIVDEGKGMGDEEKEKMFLPFYSTKKQGTGLGLPIVQRLVDSLSGHLEFKSTPGLGTTFVVYFQKYRPEKLASFQEYKITQTHL